MLKRSPINATWLAERAGVPIRTVYDFVHGTRSINIDALGRLLDALNLMLLTPEGLRAEAEKLRTQQQKETEAQLRSRISELESEVRVIRSRPATKLVFKSRRA